MGDAVLQTYDESKWRVKDVGKRTKRRLQRPYTEDPIVDPLDQLKTLLFHIVWPATRQDGPEENVKISD